MALLKYLMNNTIRKNILNIISLLSWLNKGKPIPPPHLIKELTVIKYSSKYCVKIFLETGTYKGEMINAVKNQFEKIYSIELNHDLVQDAQTKFKRYENIYIFEGDSAKKLPFVMDKINTPCVFWLDGHYSGYATSKGEKDTPIVEELQTISNHPIHTHVILIDDARLFTGNQSYPDINELKELCSKLFQNHNFIIRDDIIRISPNN